MMTGFSFLNLVRVNIKKGNAKTHRTGWILSPVQRHFPHLMFSQGEFKWLLSLNQVYTDFTLFDSSPVVFGTPERMNGLAF